MGKRSAQGANSGAVERFERPDWVAVAVLFAASLAIRVPFRSQFAYHWDSAQFALAIEHDDMRAGLPQAPGYFLYVLLGRGLNALVGDPHATLVWMSVVSGAALVALGYLLAAALFGRSCGVASAVILATSPLCWFQSEIALTPIVAGVLVMAAVLMCWRAMGSGGRWEYVIGASVMVGMTAGVRQQTGGPLLLVWLYALWRGSSGKRWRLAVAGAVFALVCGAWFIPMVKSSGNLQGYWELLVNHAKIDAPLTPWGKGMGAVGTSLLSIVTTSWSGLLIAALLALAQCVTWCATEGREGRRVWWKEYREQLALLGIWTVPMIVFGLTMYTTLPGHILVFFLALAILAGLGVAGTADRVALALGGRRKLAWGLALGVVASANVAMFSLPPDKTAIVSAGLPLAAREIREHDQELMRWMTALRARYSPEEVLLCHYPQYYMWGVRHFQYHLPDYLNCYLGRDRALLPPFDRKFWYVQGVRMEFLDRFDPKGRGMLVLVVPPGGTVTGFAQLFDVSHVKETKIDGTASLYVLPANEIGSVPRVDRQTRD